MPEHNVDGAQLLRDRQRTILRRKQASELRKTLVPTGSVHAASIKGQVAHLRVAQRQSMKVLIQSEGFTVSTTARTYNFEVTHAPGQHRKFSLEVPLGAFHGTLLKFQDGPLITHERLTQELDRETEGSRAKAHMMIGGVDISQYLERHYPPKVRRWTRPTKAGLAGRK